jgi:D-inositol-3-phosphate glycosyltransferase
VQRVAMVSMHTSPLDQPGTGDAGGLNVYVLELSRRLADAGIEVDLFTRRTSPDLASTVDYADGITVRHLDVGPAAPVAKEHLAELVPAFAGALAEADERAYDLIHSHYWLSGRAAMLASRRWDVPLVHSMHTTARMKNLTLAAGDRAEPRSRVLGEEFIAANADLLVANTDAEAAHLVSAYGADAGRVTVVHPGANLSTFRPDPLARRVLGLADDAIVLAFVGRLQPLKAPDVLLRAVAVMLARDPALRSRLVVPVIGGPSGAGSTESVSKLAAELGIADVVRLLPPVAHTELAHWYAAATLVAVPSHSETFGLVALEAQAAGTPVVAASVGGLRTAVRDGISGLLVDGHAPEAWAYALTRAIAQRDRLAIGARPHAAQFSWEATAARMIGAYERVSSAAGIDEEMTA